MKRDLEPSEAVDRFLNRRQGQDSDETVRTYKTRLKHFIAWAEENEIDSMADVDGWDIDEFYAWRESHDIKPVTVKGTMVALRQLLEFCDRLEIVEEGLADRVPTVRLSNAEESSDINLPTEQATELLSWFRDSRRYYGHAWHAFLELAWHIGARMGSLRALDLSDLDLEEGVVEFKHRPDSGTPLKKDEDGERVVGINDQTAAAVQYFVDRERPQKRDRYGREPLFATHQGRASGSTLRGYSYLGTQPCLYQACPHSKQRNTCEWTQRSHASKCPSSRSPHAIRSGSITWQLDQGIDIDLLAERVNSAPTTIRRYYDVASEHQKFRERRQHIGKNLNITEEGDG